MRILVIGGSSYFGQHLVPLARQAGHELFYTWFAADRLKLPGGHHLDVRSRQAVSDLVKQTNPDVLIHLAGSNRSGAMTAVIEEGSRWVAEAAGAAGTRLLFMSTDVVFDGKSAPYQEEDPPTPPHPYGRAKAEAEKTVAQVDNCVIVRPSLIYGLEKMDLGTAWIAEALQAGQTVTLFTDQMRAPIWADALAAACLELADHSYTGILHLAGPQPLSRADFGEKMLAWWGITKQATLLHSPTPSGSPWPLNTVLNIERAKSLLKTPLPGVDDVLERLNWLKIR